MRRAEARSFPPVLAAPSSAIPIPPRTTSGVTTVARTGSNRAKSRWTLYPLHGTDMQSPHVADKQLGFDLDEHSPRQCAGHRSCPQSYSCTE
jgi:hypothetical protein